MPTVPMSYDEATSIISVQATERSLNLYKIDENGPNLTLVGKFEQPQKGIIIQGQLARDWREHAIIQDKGSVSGEKSVVVTLSMDPGQATRFFTINRVYHTNAQNEPSTQTIIYRTDSKTLL